MNYLRYVALYFLLTILSSPLQADTAIIVHPENTITSITTDEISQLFLGKTRTFNTNEKANTYNLPEGEQSRDVFYQKLIKRTPNQVNAHWAKLIFTGKGIPPKSVSSEEDMIETIANDIYGIGYVSSNSIDDTVKVLLEIED